MRKILIVATLAVLLGGGMTWAVPMPMTWNVDPAHTQVNFTVRHFFTPVAGNFRDHEIALAFDPHDPSKSSVEARIGIASVDTGIERRDDHLRSADWFEADKYPQMTFKSTSVRAAGKDKFIATGDLTIKGVTRQIELPITLLGVQDVPPQMAAMMGGITQAASFKAELTLARNDFGVGVGSWAETMIVGGDVTVEILLEANTK